MLNKTELYKPFSIKWFISWLWVLIGAIFVAVSVVIFTAPYNIVPGGVYGIGIILNYVFPSIQVGTFGLILDIPLLLMFFLFFGRNAGLKTVVVAILTPILMNLMQDLMGTDPTTMLGGTFDLTDDKLVSSLFGGVCMGVGLGLIFNNGGTSGGSDIIAMFIHRYAKIPLSRAIMYVESTIVLVGALVIGDWRLPLYSIVFIFVMTRMINFMVEGGSGTDKLMFIISDCHDEIRDYILNDLDRGGTYLKAQGMYTHKERDIIFVVVSRNQINAVRHNIKRIDSNAFVVVVDANETLGDGFKPFPEEK